MSLNFCKSRISWWSFWAFTLFLPLGMSCIFQLIRQQRGVTRYDWAWLLWQLAVNATLSKIIKLTQITPWIITLNLGFSLRLPYCLVDTGYGLGRSLGDCKPALTNGRKYQMVKTQTESHVRRPVVWTNPWQIWVSFSFEVYWGTAGICLAGLLGVLWSSVVVG